jgi:ribosomal protein S12 methylthiotransferase accessory factor
MSTPGTLIHALRLGSSLRCRDPWQTLSIAQPLMRTLNISRLTDITRMDRLGLPVFASVRPRSRTLHVHAGKGVRPIEAKVGALMEAVEFAVAEPQCSHWERRRLRLDDMAQALPGGVRIVDLAPRFGVPIDVERVVDVVRCEELSRGRDVWLPAELVFAPFEPDDGPSVFGWTSNGLASGNTLEEATLHGLLEVLERDAIALNTPCDVSRWLHPAGLPEPFSSLAATWKALGVALAVRQVPNVFGLPCFAAWLYEAHSTSVDLAGGFGLHVDRRIALARAVCEAAQSRLTTIHGGREDVTRFYASYDDARRQERAKRIAATLSEVFDTTRRVAFDEVDEMTSVEDSVPAILQRLRERLADGGFAQVFRHRFAVDLGGLHVVKVIVARCEDMEHPPQRMGTRLFQAFQEKFARG